MEIPTVWVEDSPISVGHLTPFSTVIAADVWSEHLPVVPNVDYVLHNFNGSHHVCQGVNPDNLLRLQVYTNASSGEEWDSFRLFDREARTLFQPWGSDLFAEEFIGPIYNSNPMEVTFVGAVWSDMYEGSDLGNFQMIEKLKRACSSKNLVFRNLTHVSDDDNVTAVRAARLAPSFAGGWQVENNYLPCRVFKNVSYGVLGVTNVPAAAKLMGFYPDETMEEQFERALSLKRDDYLWWVRRQQRVAARFTYRQSIDAISRALEEIKL